MITFYIAFVSEICLSKEIYIYTLVDKVLVPVIISWWSYRTVC
jgi:hypothetical protein